MSRIPPLLSTFADVSEHKEEEEDFSDLPGLLVSYESYRKNGNHVFTQDEINRQIAVNNIDILGPDTIIMYVDSIDAIVLNLHLKEYKITSMNHFQLQLEMIKMLLQIFNEFDVIVTCDANTQISQKPNNVLCFMDKKGKNAFDVHFGFPLFVSDHQLRTTTHKMRGVHTAQQEKAFDLAQSNIDYVLFKPSSLSSAQLVAEPVQLSNIYVFSSIDNDLIEKEDEMMTTSPGCVVDHALVIENVTLSSGQNIQVATFNIKGGSAEMLDWAEFVPTKFLSYFQSSMVQKQLDLLLMRAFHTRNFAIEELFLLTQSSDDIMKQLKTPNFFSKYRFSILECHMPNGLTPFVYLDETSADVGVNDTYDFIFYEIIDTNTKPLVVSVQVPMDCNGVSGTTEIRLQPQTEGYRPWLQRFFQILCDDLNLLRGVEECSIRRRYFKERVVKLINYYALVQTDEDELGYDFAAGGARGARGATVNEDDFDDYRSLKSVYFEWYKDFGMKLSIGEVMKMMVAKNPEVKIVGFQEFPLEGVDLQLPSSVVNVVETTTELMRKKKSRGAILELNP